MKLYYSPGACSMASHIVLNEIGKPYEAERIDNKTKITATGKDFRAINPKGKVPALEVDGQVLTEGPAILQYVADAAGAEKLAPKAGSFLRARVNEVMTYVSSELHPAFSPLFNPALDDAGRETARKNVGKKLDWLESLLADGRAFLTGAEFSIADAYAFVVSNWSGHVGVSLDNWPKVKDFVARVAGRPAVQKTLKEEGLIA
ncbi:MAG TPA: glutathione transferase GstA [Albidovulum sp.]|uniref:glutathione transferase GstA n=1 Tax=Albidovulum sp. TaxID=1872424 RepID=UPI002BFC701C|nr:glutathione transferase GstA [Albidovulum sp.]